ncbi:MAG: NAD-dependent deacylase [Candidatus Omnitrophica bacterium]|nr:NAD-dependent deacylase [Candidatus Omnitrophota bacterium]
MVKKNERALDPAFEKVGRVLSKGRVACLTGAGISCESGIPAFRGKGGLWETYSPEVYGNTPGLVSLLHRDPGKFVNFIREFYAVFLDARPNPAHLALSYLEKAGLVDTVITQNIDDLHQQSGVRSVIELHGNALRIRCQGCSETLKLEKDRVREMLKLFERKKTSSQQLLRVMSRYCPRCPKCGARFRIDIVLFGEMLPEDAMRRAYQAIDSCKTLLVVGSSLVMYPAASLPQYAKDKGATLVEINREPSAMSALCDHAIYGEAGKVLPELVKLLA